MARGADVRVLLTTESYLPYVSGVTVAVDALARGLGSLGHEVLVLAPRPGTDAPLEPLGSPGPPPRHAWLPSYQLPRLVPADYRMAWPHPGSVAMREARRFRPQVVHAHSPFMTGMLAASIARGVAAPLVFTHHTRFADYGHYLGPLAAPGASMTEAYLRSFWRRCAAVIAPSSDLAAEIRARLGDGRGASVPTVVAIPTGIDVAAIRALPPVDARALAGWPHDALVVATLGRLAPEKSVDAILDAVGRAAADDARLRLLVVGGGPSEPVLRRRARQPDLVGRVHFTGALPRMEALAHLRGADLFAFASRTETQGLVLAEAIACGLPAVAVEGPGVSDSVRDGLDGLVVPADGLAAAIGRLAADAALRSELAARAAADAHRFSLDVRVRLVEACYRSLTTPG